MTIAFLGRVLHARTDPSMLLQNLSSWQSWKSVCVCVCVCVCVRERERERERVSECKVIRLEREGVQMLEFDGQNSCDHFEPVLHPPTKPSPSPLPVANTEHGCGCQISSVEWRYSTFEHRPEIRLLRTSTVSGRSAYQQTKMSPTVYWSSSNSR